MATTYYDATQGPTICVAYPGGEAARQVRVAILDTIRRATDQALSSLTAEQGIDLDKLQLMLLYNI